MSEREYYDLLDKIVDDGRGYDAVVKLGIMLEHKNAILMEKFLKESHKNGGLDDV